MYIYIYIYIYTYIHTHTHTHIHAHTHTHTHTSHTNSLQVDGFPPPEQLKTVYVEHDIQSTDAQVNTFIRTNMHT